MLVGAHLGAALVDGVPEGAGDLVAVRRIGGDDPEGVRVELLLRVLRDRPGSRALRQHVAEDVLADLGDALGRRERNDGDPDLLRAHRGRRALGEPDRSEDDDGPVLRQVVDRLRRSFRFPAGILHRHLHSAAVLQVDGEGERVEDLVAEGLEIAGQGQRDPDQGRLHVRRRGDGELNGLRAFGDGSGVHLGKDLPRQIVGVGAVAGVELDAGQGQRRRRPGGALAIEIRHQPRKARTGHRLEGALVVGEARRPILRRGRRLERAGREGRRLALGAGARVCLRDLLRALALLRLAHLLDRGAHRLGGFFFLPLLRLDLRSKRISVIAGTVQAGQVSLPLLRQR